MLGELCKPNEDEYVGSSYLALLYLTLRMMWKGHVSMESGGLSVGDTACVQKT